MQGLDEAEARLRLAHDGPNELPADGRRSSLRIAFDVVREPMLALLLVSGGIYLALGDLQEALLLLVFATASIAITVVQETRTERVLENLRNLASPRALVIRAGSRRRIAGRDVVRGDVIVLSEGDRVPADAVLVECSDLQSDESLLTGESYPVSKRPRTDSAAFIGPRSGDSDPSFVFSGALIVRGTGVAVVTATGARSEIGKIGQSLRSLETEQPRLQAQTRTLVRTFALVGAVVSVLAVLLYGLLRGGWLEAALGGIALGMSMLPEEFPVVLTVFMAMGAWRISRARVLTRRSTAIEALGSATVLCTDKTGTLTENRMAIAELWLESGAVLEVDRGGIAQLPAEFHRVVRAGILASDASPFDPMEKAFHELGARIAQEGDAKGRHLAHRWGLRPELLAVVQVWRIDGEAALEVVAKGAPEAIARLCRLSPDRRARLQAAGDAMAEKGLRVLGVAHAHHTGNIPVTPLELDFAFLGLVGLADPVRAEVPQAVADCRSAGIRVVMITGDYGATAKTIALQAGIEVNRVVTGDELARCSDKELAQLVGTGAVFSRVMPDQKLRIVQALKANGEIVAMTGDGVNDAPSLKAAHIGIAMGGRGTDVAREASSIVLLDDDFTSIVKAIRLGRRIYDNLRKAMAFIVAVHLPIAGLALLPLVLGLPLLFGPVHIAFLEMVIDPVCSLVFEAETEERNVMTRPPRNPEESLFSGWLVGWSLLQGTAAFVLVAAIYIVAQRQGMPDDELRALGFFCLVASIVALIVLNRRFSSSPLRAITRPNPALAVVLAVVGGILALTLLWPPASELFRFGPLHSDDLMLAVGASVALLLVLETVKRVLARR
jgi:P-type Ca2+ transporter type 2C